MWPHSQVTCCSVVGHQYPLHFNAPKKCKVIMTEYVSEVLGSDPVELLRGEDQACTPASNDLFKTSETEEQLSKHRSDTFHALTAPLLFYVSRADRIYKSLSRSYVRGCKRHEPTVEAWRKLGRVMRYIMKTKDMFLTLEARDFTQFQWWIDSSFNVYWDSRGHSGRSPIISTS